MISTFYSPLPLINKETVTFPFQNVFTMVLEDLLQGGTACR